MSVSGFGHRSPARPPVQYPMLIAARKTAMTAVVSRSAEPNVFPMILNAATQATSATHHSERPPRKPLPARSDSSGAHDSGASGVRLTNAGPFNDGTLAFL